MTNTELNMLNAVTAGYSVSANLSPKTLIIDADMIVFKDRLVGVKQDTNIFNDIDIIEINGMRFIKERIEE